MMQPIEACIEACAKADRSHVENRWEDEIQGRTEYGKQTIASIRMPRGEANVYPSVRRCVNALWSSGQTNFTPNTKMCFSIAANDSNVRRINFHFRREKKIACRTHPRKCG